MKKTAGILALATLAGTLAYNSIYEESLEDKLSNNQSPSKIEQTLDQDAIQETPTQSNLQTQPFVENPVWQSTNYNLWAMPTIDPATIEKVLARHKSPSRGLGQDLYDVCSESGVDPAFILAMYSHESNFGNAGVATKTKAWGNVRPGSHWEGKTQKGAIGEFRSYETHLDGMKDMVNTLLLHYTQKDTPTQVVNKYAPSSENDVAEYVKQIKDSMNHFRDLQSKKVNYAFTSQGVVELSKQEHTDWANGNLYIIEPADTPQTIAQKNNTTWKAIESYNKQLEHPVDDRKLVPRRTLYIPKIVESDISQSN